MMDIEKKLAKTDLGIFKEEPKKTLAREFIRYSKFKTSAALSKFNHMGYKDNTIHVLFDYAVKYLTTGFVHPTCGVKSFVPYLDELRSSTTPLTPKESEKRMVYKYKDGRNTKRRIPVVVAEEVVAPVVNKEVTVKFVYAVKAEGEYFVFDTEAESNAFVKACKAFDKSYETLHLTKV